MNLQTILDNAVKAKRQETLSQSDQLTLGELILKLEPFAQSRQDVDVVFDFEYFFPTMFDSWRGSYDELALCFATYENGREPMKLPVFLELCKQTIGRTFEGYKGGDFKMGKTTPVWVANYGNSGNTAVVDVLDRECQIVLITGFREF